MAALETRKDPADISVLRPHAFNMAGTDETNLQFSLLYDKVGNSPLVTTCSSGRGDGADAGPGVRQRQFQTLVQSPPIGLHSA